MELYEYLIGGKKTGRIEDLKDPLRESKPFCELKTGESIFFSEFRLDGTCAYVDEIKISSIDKESDGWIFRGVAKKGLKYARFVWMEELDKKLKAWDQHTYYEVLSAFKMDDKQLFELVKKEVKN